MDACTPVSSISEDFASCVRNAYFCCKLTYLGTKQCSRCDSAQESVKVVPVEDLNDFQGCSSNEETLKVEKLETVFSGLHTEDFFDQSPCHKPSLQLHVCDLKDGADCPKDEKQNVFQQDALDGSVKKSFSKCTTFPRSNKQPSLITSDEGEILPSASLDTQCSLKSGNLVYTRCTSLPVSSFGALIHLYSFKIKTHVSYFFRLCTLYVVFPSENGSLSCQGRFLDQNENNIMFIVVFFCL